MAQSWIEEDKGHDVFFQLLGSPVYRYKGCFRNH